MNKTIAYILLVIVAASIIILPLVNEYKIRKEVELMTTDFLNIYYDLDFCEDPNADLIDIRTTFHDFYESYYDDAKEFMFTPNHQRLINYCSDGIVPLIQYIEVDYESHKGNEYRIEYVVNVNAGEYNYNQIGVLVIDFDGLILSYYGDIRDFSELG